MSSPPPRERKYPPDPKIIAKKLRFINKCRKGRGEPDFESTDNNSILIEWVNENRKLMGIPNLLPNDTTEHELTKANIHVNRKLRDAPPLQYWDEYEAGLYKGRGKSRRIKRTRSRRTRRFKSRRK